MANLVTTFGQKTGQCNICGDIGLLTEDHTPPKGCRKPSKVELHHLSRLLGVDEIDSKGRFSQNGVKYRTLCHRCNNTLLGSKYDPAFIAFVNKVGSLLRSPIHLPHSISIQTQPQALLRSLIGHVSAQGVKRYLKGPLTEPVRDYFLDMSLPLPEGISVFYWTYPFRPHIMARDAAFLDIPSGHSFAFWLLKFFPIAFLIAWGEPKGLHYPMQTLDHWRDIPFDTVVDLPITLRPVPPHHWPEGPSDQHLLLFGSEAIYVKA